MNPIPSIIDAIKFACANRKTALGNALQFKVKKTTPKVEQNTEIVEVKINNKTFKFARKVLQDIKELALKQKDMQPDEIDAKIIEISKNARIVKSQIKELFLHLSE